MEYSEVVKLWLLGGSNVGKSQIANRFCHDEFDTNFEPTIGVEFRNKIVPMDGSHVKLQIWDLAGQERFQTITTSYYRGTQGFILVFDMTDRWSFENLDAEYEKWTRYADQTRPVILVGNKWDLVENIQVDEFEAQQWASLHNMDFVMASAATNHNIDEIFYAVALDAKLKTLYTFYYPDFDLTKPTKEELIWYSKRRQRTYLDCTYCTNQVQFEWFCRDQPVQIWVGCLEQHWSKPGLSYPHRFVPFRDTKTWITDYLNAAESEVENMRYEALKKWNEHRQMLGEGIMLFFAKELEEDLQRRVADLELNIDRVKEEAQISLSENGKFPQNVDFYRNLKREGIFDYLQDHIVLQNSQQDFDIEDQRERYRARMSEIFNSINFSITVDESN